MNNTARVTALLVQADITLAIISVLLAWILIMLGLILRNVRKS